MNAQSKTVAKFAGIGLMRVVLVAAGWQISFANDVDERELR
jgi:hypothetical protein